VFIIAENINIMSRRLGPAIKERRKGPIQEMARALVAAGADALDVNLGPARKGGEELMRFVVGTVAEVAPVQLCLDTTNAAAMEAGILTCAELGLPTPIVNSFSLQPDRLEAILPLAARHGCEVVGLCMAEGVPADADERLALAYELVSAANAAGIPNDRIFVDPIVLPLTVDVGQQQAMAVQETLRGLAELFDPPVRSTCGLSNVSNGAPAELRSPLNCVFAAMLASLGIASAIVDALDPHMMRTLRLTRAFRNQTLFSLSDAELA